MIITLNQLVEKNACRKSREKFLCLFGRQIELPNEFQAQKELADTLAVHFCLNDFYWYIDEFLHIEFNYVKEPNLKSKEEEYWNVYLNTPKEIFSDAEEAFNTYQKAVCDLHTKHRGEEWLKIIQLLTNNSDSESKNS